MKKNKSVLRLLAAPALALLMLSGCTQSFNANVARFQQLPPAQGQMFAIVPEDNRNAGGLEFAHYADLVAQHLVNLGYVRAPRPEDAHLIVRLAYGVDQGRERIESYGPYWGGWGYPYGGFGWRGRYMLGFNDPFLYGGYNDISSYTVYGSILKMRIDDAKTGKAVFEGAARAQSLSNNLTYLVPNLIEAMFTGFPGNSGEDVKVTIAPEPKSQAQK
jgi:hypothetical protein